MARKNKGFFIFLFLISLGTDGYILEQVLVLGRHHVRTPLNTNLELMTPKTWPKWSEDSRLLTSKGALLEGYMGEYFYEWMIKEELWSKECPTEDLVYVYANAPQRTKRSAEVFIESAFKDCYVPVHYSTTKKRDPIFNPVIRNTSKVFKNIVLRDLQKNLRNTKLRDAYLELNRILDIKQSGICKLNSLCNLAELQDYIKYKIGKIPNVNFNGALSIGNSLMDNFLMRFYDGMPLESIAWGQIQPNQWKSLMEITRQNQNVRYNSSLLAKDIAKPLLKYIFHTFLDETPIFTLLVGHDVNLYSVIVALDFKPYELPNQFEKTPIGGKLVFQKWYDEKYNRDLLKINYVYQSTEQIRDGIKLSLTKPPESAVMELKNCKIDDNGYCLWKDFLKIIDSFS